MANELNYTATLAFSVKRQTGRQRRATQSAVAIRVANPAISAQLEPVIHIKILIVL